MNRIAEKVAALFLFLLVPCIILILVASLSVPIYIQSSSIKITISNQTDEVLPSAPLGYAKLNMTFTKQDLQDPRYDLAFDLQVECNQTPSLTYAVYLPEVNNYTTTTIDRMVENDSLDEYVGTPNFKASYTGWEGLFEFNMNLEGYEPYSFPLDVYETPKIIVAVNAEESNSTYGFLMSEIDLNSKVPPGFSATISDYKELSNNETAAQLGNRPNLVNGLVLTFKVTFLRNTQSLPLLLIYLVAPSLGIWCLFSVTQFRCNDYKDRLMIFAGALFAAFAYLLTFRNFAPPTLTLTEIFIILLMGAWAFIEMIQALHSVWTKPQRELSPVSRAVS
jgi:hypothetical protein